MIGDIIPEWPGIKMVVESIEAETKKNGRILYKFRGKVFSVNSNNARASYFNKVGDTAVHRIYAETKVTIIKRGE